MNTNQHEKSKITSTTYITKNSNTNQKIVI